MLKMYIDGRPAQPDDAFHPPKDGLWNTHRSVLGCFNINETAFFALAYDIMKQMLYMVMTEKVR